MDSTISCERGNHKKLDSTHLSKSMAKSVGHFHPSQSIAQGSAVGWLRSTGQAGNQRLNRFDIRSTLKPVSSVLKKSHSAVTGEVFYDLIDPKSRGNSYDRSHSQGGASVKAINLSRSDRHARNHRYVERLKREINDAKQIEIENRREIFLEARKHKWSLLRHVLHVLEVTFSGIICFNS